MPPKLFGHFTPKPSNNNKCSTKSRSQSRCPWHAPQCRQPASPPTRRWRWPWPRLCGLDCAINAQSRCNQTPVGRSGTLRSSALCYAACWMSPSVQRAEVGGGGWYAGRKAWQLGKAKLFSMHALKGAEPLCASLLSRKIFVRRPPPPKEFHIFCVELDFAAG